MSRASSFSDESFSSCLLSKTIIMPVVLYECETWSLTLREHKAEVVCE
jgi:hypothetical protein